MKLPNMILTVALSAVAAMQSFAANTAKTVYQVTDGVTLSTDVDYVITAATPFTTAGSVNITNTDHAVVILQNVRPSAAIKNYLGNILINGAKAVNNTNCQVKMYAQGSIILPYTTAGIKPLTVFSEQDFAGTSVNAFGLENTGGFMNTLTDAKLNNKIRSFKLKRGYMVTFSTLAGGYGYSRCFIADKEDLEIASLPAVLDGKISSYRVFVWYDASKKGLASDTGEASNSALNSSWCYSWGTGESRLPDAECVPNHIYEDWPSPSACGSVNYSCHMKTNNEPGNSADDHPQDVSTVLDNWQNLMRTGFRLCSETSHDGSMGHLKAFIDSIDARGWRCDVIDLHCYWAAGSFNNLDWYSSNYGNGRPIWISEWVWGASWNNNGAFAVSDRNAYEANWANTYNGTKPILDVINSTSKVERYAYWNSEANCSKIYLNGKLSTLGEYYAKMTPGLAYNKANEFVPKNPPQYAPSNLAAEYDKDNHKVSLSWHEPNGEYNQSMVIQVKKPGSSTWTAVQTIEQKEQAADYEFAVDGTDGYKYRIFVTDLNGVKRYSNEAQAVNNDLSVGDEVTVGDDVMYLGGNILVNGDFDMGLTDWQNGAGKPLSQPFFQVVQKGSIDGGAYLQAYGGSDDKASEESLRKVMALEKYSAYYVQAAGCNNTVGTTSTGSTQYFQRISTSTNDNIELNSRVNLPAISSWATQGTGFQTTKDSVLIIQFRSCGGTAQFDKIMVAKLFSTRDSALADALVCAKNRAEAFKQYNTQYPALNVQMDELIATCTSAAEVEAGVQHAIDAMRNIPAAQTLYADAEMVVSLRLTGYENVEKALNASRSAITAEAANDAYADLAAALDAASFYTRNTSAIVSPDFSSTNGWNLKQGTYTGGDQRTATQAGLSCWNAWWSTSASGGSSLTMAVNQYVQKLAHGFYALEAKAATQHYCLSDQHAYIDNGTEKAMSPSLSTDLLDIPSVADADKWETLVTPYLFINDGDTLTVGFEGSKQGAVDNAWHKYGTPNDKGDKREGWWCATGFSLRHVPAYMKTVDDSHFASVCLAYDFAVPDGVQLFQIAGITADSTRICLEPVESGKAGYPYIMKTDKDNVLFVETGTKVTVAQTNVNGFRGMLVPTSNYPLNALVLEHGTMKVVTERYPIRSYEGFVQKVSNLPVVDVPTPDFVWTSGLVSDEKIQEVAMGMPAVGTTAVGNDVPAFDLSGRRIKADTRGVIVTKGRKTVK